MASLTIGRVKNIPLKLHWSFLLLLPLFAYLMGRFYFAEDPGVLMPTGVDLAWGAALAVFLFTTVLLHELGHSLTALKYNVRIRGITLLPIGGVSQMEEMPRKPSEEFAVSLMGPVINFVIGIPILVYAWFAFGPAAIASVTTLPDWQQFVVWAGALSVFIGAFNLFVPAFPMDGGRILRALLARRMGAAKATHIAANVGRALALAMGLIGLLGGGILLILIAFFVWIGAGQEEQSVKVTSALGDIRLGEIMTRNVDSLGPDERVTDVFDRMMTTKHLVLPVVDGGRVVGLVHLRDLADVPRVEHEARLARDVMRTDFVTLRANAQAARALKHVSEGTAGPIVVTREDGTLEGIVSRTDIVRTVQILHAENGGEAPQDATADPSRGSAGGGRL